MTTLPDSLTAALPSRERRSPALALADGRWLAAARAGLYVFPAPMRRCPPRCGEAPADGRARRFAARSSRGEPAPLSTGSR